MTGPLARVREVAARLRRRRKPVRLSLLAATEASGVPTPERGTFTLPQVQALEKHFSLPPHAHLSPHLTVRPGDGSIAAPSTEHVGRFVDALSTAVAARRGHVGDLRHLEPDAAGAVMVAHLASEAGHAALMPHGADAGQWYGKHVQALVDAARDVHGIEPGSARDTLHRVLIAINSSGQNPKQNTATAYKQLAQAGGDFLRITPNNEGHLAAWQAAYTTKHGAPASNAPVIDENRSLRSLDASARWYAKHVQPHPSLRGVNAGYSGVPVRWDADARRVTAYQRAGQWVQVRKPREGAKQETFMLPLQSLRAKSWSHRGEALAASLRNFQTVVRNLGGEEPAAGWLLGLHPWESIRSVLPTAQPPEYHVPEWGQAYPGMFVFGPKIGSFALNLHSHERPDLARYLTADLWFTRTWLRLLGGLSARVANAGPESAAERKQMYHAVRAAAAQQGLTVAQMQAMLWYHEQRLYQLLGAKADSYSYSDGAEHMRQLHAAGRKH